MFINSTKLWVTAKDYVMIVVGILLYAFGFCAFILPEKVVIGGVSGLGSIVYFVTANHWGHGIPVAVTQYAVNLLLLAIAWKKVGKTFVIRTIFGATVIAVAVGIFQPMFPTAIVKGQPFMNVLLGAFLCGAGIGMVFVHNGSTGGTDIVAAMVAKVTNVSIGRTMIYVDMCIIGSSYFIFGQVDKVIYGALVLFIVPLMADMIINTNRQAVQFLIISNRWEDIATAINFEARRGCTIIDGKGWYTKHELKILLVVCRKIESVTIFRIIKSIDEHAFITQGHVNGVYGQGFDTIKFKPRKTAHPLPSQPVTGVTENDTAKA